jgi:predicted RNA binding protein YcfA (HicA-like mRNA interferase family)
MVVPMHTTRPIPVGTLSAILRDLDIPLEKFLEEL